MPTLFDRPRRAVGCPAWPACGCGTQSGPHTCEWRAECHRRYRKLGIDVNNPNPDSSDYRLMNVIDDEVTREWGK
jgi:hypothetical protein